MPELSDAEIAALPRWAAVALAARAARRLVPLVRAWWPDAPAEYADAIEAAVTLAEGAALAGARPAPAAAQAAITAAVYAGHRAPTDESSAPAFAAESAARAARAPDRAGAADAAADAAASAQGADEHPAAPNGHVAAALRLDYEALAAAARAGRWADDTPAPRAVVLAPPWPAGEPPWWPGRAPEPWGVRLAALVSMVFTEDELRRALRVRLNLDLDELVSARAGRRDRTLELVAAAERRGEELALAEALAAERPGRPEFATLVGERRARSAAGRSHR